MRRFHRCQGRVKEELKKIGRRNSMKKDIITVEGIENKIYLIRGQKVILDRDLSMLYGVQTKHLKRAVKRNMARFPEDFMFPLNKSEMQTLGYHFGTPVQHLFGGYQAFAFTEQGVAMLSSVLKSKRAVQVNIQIMRAFVKLRAMLVAHKELAAKLFELERKYEGHDVEIKQIFTAIRQLMSSPKKKPEKFGFIK